MYIHDYAPAELRTLREREGVSRVRFADALNVAAETVALWERGRHKPSGCALRLLDIVERKGLEFIC